MQNFWGQTRFIMGDVQTPEHIQGQERKKRPAYLQSGSIWK